MLEKRDWDGFAKRLLRNIENGEPELCESSYEMPASHYLDEDRWKREIEVIFKRQPLILAMSCELPEPNSFRTSLAGFGALNR